MIVSFAESLLLVKKWKEESSRVALLAAWESIVAIYLVGSVLTIEGSTVLLEFSGENVFILDLARCTLQYGEPRRLPERLVKKLGGIERSLYVTLPNGIDFFFCELKPATSA
jgi:hypothetical protein